MAFYHEDGLVPSWKNASAFAGKDGRVATLPDIARVRIATGIDDFPWNTYFTTNSAEYVGMSRGGNKIIVVAHGVGPMSTLDGILAAYKYQYSDKTRNRRGGRISRADFLKLESGAFGEVAIVDFADYVGRYDYPFLEHHSAVLAIKDKLLKARLGSEHTAYVNHHMRMARQYHRERGDGEEFNPIILQVGDASNRSYIHWNEDSDGALAHLLSVGALANVHLSDEGYPRYPVLACTFSVHEWQDGVRFVGVRADASLASVHSGIDLHRLLPDNWQLVVTDQNLGSTESRFHALMKFGNQWFTEYPKVGATLDTGEPKFHVTKLEKIGSPVTFKTTIGGWHGWLKYDIREVRGLAPQAANAYYFDGEIKIIYMEGNPEFHEVPVQFCRVEVDYSQRILRSKELASDLPRILHIAETLNLES